MTRHPISWALILPLLASCGGDQPPPVTPPPPPADTATATAAPPEPEVSRELPKTGDPANHYLQDDVWLTASKAYEQGYVYGTIAVQLAPRSGPKNRAKFFDFYSSKETERAHFWRTRAAKADQIVPGKIVAVVDRPGGQDALYGPPESVEQAYQSRWWLARVVNQRSKGDGFVLLAGGHRAVPTALRLLEGDDSPALSKQGTEDAHFIGEEHWFAARQPLPSGTSHIYLALSLPVKPEAPLEGGEGVFMETKSGKLARFSHVWQTRVASKGDLKKGQVVLAPDLKKQGAAKTYRAPKTRIEALNTRWWAVVLDDVSGASKGTVKGGAYTFAIGALRVVK